MSRGKAGFVEAADKDENLYVGTLLMLGVCQRQRAFATEAIE